MMMMTSLLMRCSCLVVVRPLVSCVAYSNLPNYVGSFRHETLRTWTERPVYSGAAKQRLGN